MRDAGWVAFHRRWTLWARVRNSVRGCAGDFTSLGVQEQLGRAIFAAEIKHVGQIPGLHIGRAMAKPRKSPVVFNEARNRALVRDGMVNKIPTGERGSDQQRLTWTESAPRLLPVRHAECTCPAFARVRKCIQCRL